MPCFYELDPCLLSTAPVIEVNSRQTSGEVEPVLIRHGNKYYLGIGSDHTDRGLERVDIEASKKSCPKPIGKQVFSLPASFADLAWDSIRASAKFSPDALTWADTRVLALPLRRLLQDGGCRRARSPSARSCPTSAPASTRPSSHSIGWAPVSSAR
ncbi:MAG: DUF2848 domain-containing protein [Actinobacteria bacterium]|nr:DUF2848 domain-containing protein [Actinomycetota bacterium]